MGELDRFFVIHVRWPWSRRFTANTVDQHLHRRPTTATFQRRATTTATSTGGSWKIDIKHRLETFSMAQLVLSNYWLKQPFGVRSAFTRHNEFVSGESRKKRGDDTPLPPGKWHFPPIWVNEQNIYKKLIDWKFESPSKKECSEFVPETCSYLPHWTNALTWVRKIFFLSSLASHKWI